MDYAELRREIADDPIARGYAGKTEQEIAALLNAPDRPGPIPAQDVRRYLTVADRWPEIVRISRFGDADPDRVRAAIRMVEALDGIASFDLQVPAYLATIEAGLDALVAAQIVQAQDKAAILGLAQNRRSRAAELGLGQVKPGHVQAALAQG